MTYFEWRLNRAKRATVHFLCDAAPTVCRAIAYGLGALYLMFFGWACIVALFTLGGGS